MIPRFRSKLGGLWTDLSNATEIVRGKLALGWITDEEALLLLAFIENGYVILRGAAEDEISGKLNEDIEVLLREQRTLIDLHYVQPSVRKVIFCPRTLRFLHLVFERPALAHRSSLTLESSDQSVPVRMSSPMELCTAWTALEDQTLMASKGDVLIWKADFANRSTTGRGILAHYSPSDNHPIYPYPQTVSPVLRHAPGALYCRADQPVRRSNE